MVWKIPALILFFVVCLRAVEVPAVKPTLLPRLKELDCQQSVPGPWMPTSCFPKKQFNIYKKISWFLEIRPRNYYSAKIRLPLPVMHLIPEKIITLVS